MFLEITVVCRIYPTEEYEKVVKCIRNIFPNAKIERKGDYVIGKGSEEDIYNFVHIVKREGLSERVVSLIRARRKKDSVTLPVDRDAAFFGKLSFVADGELAPIWIEIRGDIDALVASFGGN